MTETAAPSSLPVDDSERNILASRLGRRGLLAAAGVPALIGAGLLGASQASAAPVGRRPADESTQSALTSDVPAVTLEDLRTMTTAPETDLYLLTDPGMEGLFRYDPADTSSADNTGTVVVSAGGARFRRAASEALNVRWFGAKGDGANDDRGPIQAAIDAARGIGGAVYIPSGIYAIGAPLIIPATGDGGVGPRIFGDSFMHGASSGPGSTIIPLAFYTGGDPIQALIMQEPGSEGQTARRMLELEHLALVAVKAEYGLYFDGLQSCTLRRVSVRNAIKDGFAFGWGFYNQVENCRFFNNGRDGIRTIRGAINTFNITDTQFLRNGEIGLNLDQDGGGIRIMGCSFEGHGVTGIHVRGGSRSVNISHCYFESNLPEDGPGFTFDDPATNVRADILVNGTNSRGPIGSDWAAGAMSITENICVVHSKGPEDFVAGFAGHTRFEVVNNSFHIVNAAQNNPTMNVLRTGTSQTGRGSRVENLVMAGNDVREDRRDRMTLNTLQVDDLAGGQSLLHDASIEGVFKTNYASALPEFRQVEAGASGAWASARTSYRAQPVWTVKAGRAGESDVYGVEIDLAEATELAGKYVYFACFAKTTGDAEVILWTSQLGNGPAQATGAEWQVISYVDLLPETGVVSFGVRSSSDSAGGSVQIARPVLAEVGARFSDLA